MMKMCDFLNYELRFKASFFGTLCWLALSATVASIAKESSGQELLRANGEVHLTSFDSKELYSPLPKPSFFTHPHVRTRRGYHWVSIPCLRTARRLATRGLSDRLLPADLPWPLECLAAGEWTWLSVARHGSLMKGKVCQ